MPESPQNKNILDAVFGEMVVDDGPVRAVFGEPIAPKTPKAKKIVEDMTHEFTVGEILKGEVVKVADFGAFVRLNEMTDGMVHISELAPFRVERVSDIIKEGMIVPVKVISVDAERGKVGLSIRAVDENFFKKV